MKDPSHNFWAEVKRICCNKASYCKIVDGCSVGDETAQLFAQKYRALYTSLPYDSVELENNAVCEVEDQIRGNIAAAAGHLVCSEDIKDAIDKLKPYKYDGYSACSSDHFIHAG